MAKQSQKVAAFIQGGKRKPPPDWWKQSYTPFRGGPHQSDPKNGSGVLGSGSVTPYFIPGLGEYGRIKNVAKYRQKHAFNPGPRTGRISS